MRSILERLKEPSTYAGIGLIAAALGWSMEWQYVVQIAVGAAGLLSLLLSEKK